jgi:hypothetical protein
MPRYLLRFKVETCLTHAKDLTVDFGGHKSVFLFSKRTSHDGHVVAQIELEATNNEQAWVAVASNLLPPILDALSFATGTPLLLRDCEVILKDEAGSAKRRVLYIGHRHVPTQAPLRDFEIDEMQTILAAGEDLRLPLCWHRYALDRKLALEHFVFNWLAFEALAGDADVASRCPKCHEELKHCDLPVVHRGSSKTAARQIFQAAHPETTDQEFNNQIWSKARSYVFHGRHYPDPTYLNELLTHSKRPHKAVDSHIDETLGLGNRVRPHQGYEAWSRLFIFVEWTTQHPADQFAIDWPAMCLAKMAEEGDANNQALQAAIADGITLLNHREMANW